MNVNKIKKQGQKVMIALLSSGMIFSTLSVPTFAANSVKYENDLIQLEKNLIVNSSFDKGTNWRKTGNGDFTNYEGAAYDAGGWCGILPSNSGNASVYQVVNLEKNTDYIIKVKMQLAKEGQTAFLNVKSEDVQNLPGGTPETAITCTHEQAWKYQDIELKFNSGNNTRVSICAMKWTEDTSSATYTGQVYVDNLTLEKVGTKSDNYEILWGDDFNQSSLDTSTWDYELGHIRGIEQQHYVRSDENVYVKDGNLTIKATDRPVESQYNVGGRQVIYNSGSIRTHDSQEFLYGRLEMKAKLPKGKGVFPAFWTLGSDFVLDGMIDDMQGYGWPRCGEIDIMELTGDASGTGNKTVWQTIHTGDSDDDHKLAGAPGYTIANNFNDEYHVFGINWSKNKVEWYVDNKIVKSVTYENDVVAQRGLNKPHYVQFNLAMGGAWPGEVGTDLAGTTYDVDYVYYAQNEQQKADAAEYYSTTPKITGAQNITIQQGDIPDLLNGMSTTSGYTLDYSIDNDSFFNNNAGNSSVKLLVKGKKENEKIATLEPGQYTVYYTAIPENPQTDATNPNILDRKADYRFARKTMSLTIQERSFPTDLKLIGVYGEELSTVELPENWTWDQPDTVLNQSQNQFKVNYSQNGFTTSTTVAIQLVAADKSNLSQVLNQANIYIQDETYTEDSLLKLKTEILNTEMVMNKEDATKQEVITAIQNLNAIISKLEKKPIIEQPVTPPSTHEDKYIINEGQGVIVQSGKEASFRSNASIEKFKEVLLDGFILDQKYYTVKEGSTIITLHPEFTKTLSAGKHTLRIVSTDGQATTKFNVEEVPTNIIAPSKPTIDNSIIHQNNTTVNQPQTGDSIEMISLFSLLMISGIGYYMSKIHKKHNVKIRQNN